MMSVQRLAILEPFIILFFHGTGPYRQGLYTGILHYDNMARGTPVSNLVSDMTPLRPVVGITKVILYISVLSLFMVGQVSAAPTISVDLPAEDQEVWGEVRFVGSVSPDAVKLEMKPDNAQNWIDITGSIQGTGWAYVHTLWMDIQANGEHSIMFRSMDITGVYSGIETRTVMVTNYDLDVAIDEDTLKDMDVVSNILDVEGTAESVYGNGVDKVQFKYEDEDWVDCILVPLDEDGNQYSWSYKWYTEEASTKYGDGIARVQVRSVRGPDMSREVMLDVIVSNGAFNNEAPTSTINGFTLTDDGNVTRDSLLQGVARDTDQGVKSVKIQIIKDSVPPVQILEPTLIAPENVITSAWSYPLGTVLTEDGNYTAYILVYDRLNEVSTPASISFHADIDLPPILTPPASTNITNVYRTEPFTFTIEAEDDDGAENLTFTLHFKLSTEAIAWNGDNTSEMRLGIPWFDHENSTWNIDLTPTMIAKQLTYDVRVKVQDAKNPATEWLRFNTIFRVRNYLPIPEAGSNQEVYTLETVVVDGNASEDPDGLITSWEWDFGDLTMPEESSSSGYATHSYARSGTYVAVLTVTDDAEDYNWDTISITVNNRPPHAGFLVSPLRPAPNDPANFVASTSNDDDGNIVAYKWDFGDGTLTNWSVDNSFIHEFTGLNETYHVTLFIQDDEGLVNSTTIPVEINFGGADDEVIYTGTTSFQVNQDAQFFLSSFTNLDVDETTFVYKWDLDGDGDFEDANMDPTKRFVRAGATVVSMTIISRADGRQMAVYSFNVTVTTQGGSNGDGDGGCDNMFCKPTMANGGILVYGGIGGAVVIGVAVTSIQKKKRLENLDVVDEYTSMRDKKRMSEEGRLAPGAQPPPPPAGHRSLVQPGQPGAQPVVPGAQPVVPGAQPGVPGQMAGAPPPPPSGHQSVMPGAAGVPPPPPQGHSSVMPGVAPRPGAQPMRPQQVQAPPAQQQNLAGMSIEEAMGSQDDGDIDWGDGGVSNCPQCGVDVSDAVEAGWSNCLQCGAALQ